MRPRSIAAVFFGGVAFGFSLLVFSALFPLAIDRYGVTANTIWEHLIFYGFWFTFAISGFVAACIAPSKKISHGAVAGCLIGALFSILALWYPELDDSPSVLSVVRTIATTTFVSALGASLVLVPRIQRLLGT